ncbi:porin [Rhodobacteraceae bacterium CCMM004]|nr:porin [Rhodobacteraceae bacterium CCMM004]
MKKVLFATTALVASASFAMADVDLEGTAVMGIAGGDGMEDQFWTDIDVKFRMSGETDGGLTFGAEIDLDEADGAGSCRITDNDATNGPILINGEPVDIGPIVDSNGDTVSIQDADQVAASCSARGNSLAFDGATQGGETIFISGNFGTITMGDTDGALDWAMQEVGIGASLGDTHTSHAGYNGNAGLDILYDGQIVRYDYTFGDFSFAASALLDDDPTDGAGPNQPDNGDTVFAIGARYSANLGGVDLGLGIGYQTANNIDLIGVSADVEFAQGFRAIVNYTDMDSMVVDFGDNGGNRTVDAHWGIGLGYETGAILVSANYGRYDLTAGGEIDGYGLAVNYDLGGGASLQAGYGGGDGPDAYSFGVAMEF